MKMIEIIIEYATMWTPALVAVLSIIATVCMALGKVKTAIDTFKSDKTLADLHDDLARLSNENNELVRCNKLLLDKITKIENYADLKKGE